MGNLSDYRNGKSVAFNAEMWQGTGMCVYMWASKEINMYLIREGTVDVLRAKHGPAVDCRAQWMIVGYPLGMCALCHTLNYGCALPLSLYVYCIHGKKAHIYYFYRYKLKHTQIETQNYTTCIHLTTTFNNIYQIMNYIDNILEITTIYRLWLIECWSRRLALANFSSGRRSACTESKWEVPRTKSPCLCLANQQAAQWYCAV